MVFANCLIEFAKEQSQNKERLKLVSKKLPTLVGKANRSRLRKKIWNKGEICVKKEQLKHTKWLSMA